MFRNLKKKKKKINWKKMSKIIFFASYLNFVFALYTLISPNLQKNLKKIFIYPTRFQRVELVLRISKKLAVISFHETLIKTQTKKILCPLGVNKNGV